MHDRCQWTDCWHRHHFIHPCAQLAKHNLESDRELVYVAYELSESASLPTSRLYNGIRRIDVSLPAVLVAELDRNILEFGFYLRRSSVIEVAIRQFLERGGVTGPAPKVPHR